MFFMNKMIESDDFWELGVCVFVCVMLVLKGLRRVIFILFCKGVFWIGLDDSWEIWRRFVIGFGVVKDCDNIVWFVVCVFECLCNVVLVEEEDKLFLLEFLGCNFWKKSVLFL